MTTYQNFLADFVASDSPLFDGLMVIDVKDRILQANHQAWQLLHQQDDRHFNKSFISLIEQLPPSPSHPDFSTQAIIKLIQAARQSSFEDPPQSQTFCYLHQQTERWLLIKAVRSPWQDVIGLSLCDITKKYQQDQQKIQQLAEIADQNRQWQAIFNGVQESIVLLDKTGLVVTINPATERITGRKSSEVIGQHIGQLFPKVDPAVPGLDRQGRSGLDQVMQDLRPSDLFEAVVQTKDHRHIWVNYTYTPLKDPKGELTGFIRVTSDVSTVKAVDQMKNDFISIASHELRTPLGVINSYLNLFLNGQLGSLTDDQKLFMQRIQHSSSDMSALVEDLLNMSRIEDGRINIAVQPTNLGEVIQEAMAHLEPRYRAKNITINFKLPDPPLIVQLDKQKVEQALTNLIDNAIKYTYDNGTVTIEVDQGDHAAKVAISDTGVGIRPENLTHIFEKFYREGNSLSIKEGGSGLGLYISRKLVELHGGTISASSTHNQGSTFTVHLPLNLDSPHIGQNHSERSHS